MFCLLDWSRLKRMITPSADEDAGKKAASCTAVGELAGAAFWRRQGALTVFKMHSAFNPAFLLLGLYHEEIDKLHTQEYSMRHCLYVYICMWKIGYKQTFRGMAKYIVVHPP